MDLEFKCAEEKWDFCAALHKKLTHAYESKKENVELSKTEQFRLVRVLEEMYYPNRTETITAFKRRLRLSEIESTQIMAEYLKAKACFPEFNSLHEAYAVIKEELEEFWDVVKLKQNRNPTRTAQAREEILQVGAMCLGVLVEFPQELV